MIAAHNRRQLALAFLSALIGVACSMLAFVFFRFAARFVGTSIEWSGLVESSEIIAGIAVGALFLSGYRLWRSGIGHTTFVDSSLNVNVEAVSGGAMMTGVYAQRVSVPAYFLSQVFLAGPLQLLGAYTKIRSRIPDEPGLEARLENLLATLIEKDKWESLTDYPQQLEELNHLIRMGKLQYSPSSRKFRAKG